MAVSIDELKLPPFFFFLLASSLVHRWDSLVWLIPQYHSSLCVLAIDSLDTCNGQTISITSLSITALLITSRYLTPYYLENSE